MSATYKAYLKGSGSAWVRRVGNHGAGVVAVLKGPGLGVRVSIKDAPGRWRSSAIEVELFKLPTFRPGDSPMAGDEMDGRVVFRTSAQDQG